MTEPLRLLVIEDIAMAANAFAEDRDACLAAGIDDHVAKPANSADQP